MNTNSTNKKPLFSVSGIKKDLHGDLESLKNNKKAPLLTTKVGRDSPPAASNEAHHKKQKQNPKHFNKNET